MQNFVEYCLERNGSIKPLLLDPNDIIGPSLTNPSVYNDNGQLLVNIRNVNYALYHAERERFQHWGPLVYIHREDDVTLTTHNFIASLDDDCNIQSYYKVDTSKHDVEPLWEFIGLEDCRLIRWDGKLYQCGVRRDTTTNGVGRMELSEVRDGSEVSRWRIPAPGPDNTYCEKNWMPIVDQPYRYVKWCNPVEIVEVDPIKKTCETVHVGKFSGGHKDWRGGSQVIPLFGKHVCIVHETDLWFTETRMKNARYRHRFLVFDENWNLEKVSPVFSFMSAEIEFCCGIAEKDGEVYITFGYQDNAAFILKASEEDIKDFIYDSI